MQAINAGGRFTAASLSVCLALLASASPTLAINQVTAAGQDGNGMCVSCGQNQTHTTSGSATGGSASNNSGGSGSTFDLNYVLPSDGQPYYGTLMTQVVLSDGNVSVQTWPANGWGTGEAGFASAWNNASIPLGGSASITLNMTGGDGTPYVAGFRVDNFGK